MTRKASDSAGSRDPVLQLLRDRHAPAASLARIARDPRFARDREVKRAVAVHPNTPLAVSRNLLPQLFWREWIEAVADSRLHPVVRRTAEECLERCLDQLALGERVALARRASGGILGCLATSRDVQVLTALVGNPRLDERDALRIASDVDAPPEALVALASHDKWGFRLSVRRALVKNHRTPVVSALRLVETLDERELRRLAQDDKVLRIVRVAADRRLHAVRSANASMRRSDPA